MKVSRKTLLVLSVLWVLPLGLALGAAAWVMSAGTIAVNVDERRSGGGRIQMKVPASMVHLALQFVPEFVCSEAAEQASRWAPSVQALCSEFENCADGVFVEVESRDETVKVAKEGKSLVVDVDCEDGIIHATVPISTLSTVVSKLGGGGRGWGCRLKSFGT